MTRWCKDNYLDLNVEKTREMVVDFRRNECVGELVIGGVTVEKVNEYKYIGTVLENKLTFESNTNCNVKKCHQRMFCMFRLRSFDVSRKNGGSLNSFVNRGSKFVYKSRLTCVTSFHSTMRHYHQAGD